MKTAWYSRNGPANSVLEFGEKPKPEAGASEVLVRLETSGVNPSDVKSRAGRPLAFDFVVPHSDGAGVIEAVGAGVSNSRVGERVWIWNGQWQRQFGTAAEFIAVPEHQAVKLPEEVSFDVAACFGIPGLTAAHAANLVEAEGPGDVLVTGAGSAVGHYLTQMLVQSGHRVIATASESRARLARDAGAAEVIDYRSENVSERVREITNGAGVGIVVDMDFSSTSLLLNTDAVSPHATVYCYGSNDMGELGIPFRNLLFKSITLKFFLVYELRKDARAAAIDRLMQFISTGSLKTEIASFLALAQIGEAHQLVESGGANGNVVLRICD